MFPPSTIHLILTSYSGLFAIKDYRDAVNQDDFNKAVRKVAESKKLEGKLEYQKL
jgi:26S proteasome regulatory subunit T4